MNRALLVVALFSLAINAGAQESVPIEFPENDEFLPKNWKLPPISASIEPLKPENRAFAKKVIEKALNKYPAALASENLRGVSLVSSLKFYSVSYGGTYFAKGKRIVLVYRETFDPRGFEQRFHHEFSSILLDANEEGFEELRWRTANPPGYKYRAGGVIEEQSGDRSEATKVLALEQEKTGGSGSTLLRLNKGLMEKGFLTPYNQISVEQDVNETAAHLFTNPEIWNLCVRFPRIDQKVDVLIDFYRGLNPVMDRIYFRNMTRGENAEYPEQ